MGAAVLKNEIHDDVLGSHVWHGTGGIAQGGSVLSSSIRRIPCLPANPQPEKAFPNEIPSKWMVFSLNIARGSWRYYMIIKAMEGVRRRFVGFPVGIKRGEKRMIGLYWGNNYVQLCSLEKQLIELNALSTELYCAFGCKNATWHNRLKVRMMTMNEQCIVLEAAYNGHTFLMVPSLWTFGEKKNCKVHKVCPS